MQKKDAILIVDDNEDLLKAAKMFLKRHFAIVDVTDNPESIPNLLMNESYDMVLLDMNFTKDVSSGKEGFDWLETILEIDPSLAVVLITAYGDVQMAVQAIKAGATNFILKPWENEKLLETLRSSLEQRKRKLENKSKPTHLTELNPELRYKYDEIIGESAQMKEIFALIDRVAKTDANILILGENGTGKELIARSIYRNSRRNEKSFISVDLGSISENLFESELFGHKKGAFTDANEDRVGRFEIASGGTLFLDEIGNLSLALQAKLLAALQNRKINRVGSNKEIPVDIRLICATNLELYKMVEKNTFRQDLIYRINTIEINIPPLRERIDDIGLLAQHFIHIYNKKYGKNIAKLSDAAYSRMIKYNWPGNIRELQHTIERAIIMSVENVLQPEDFDFKPQFKVDTRNSLLLENSKLKEVEKILIKQTLKKNRGNITLTAEDLGITRASLYRRLEKHDL